MHCTPLHYNSPGHCLDLAAQMTAKTSTSWFSRRTRSAPAPKEELTAVDITLLNSPPQRDTSHRVSSRDQQQHLPPPPLQAPSQPQHAHACHRRESSTGNLDSALSTLFLPTLFLPNSSTSSSKPTPPLSSQPESMEAAEEAVWGEEDGPWHADPEKKRSLRPCPSPATLDFCE